MARGADGSHDGTSHGKRALTGIALPLGFVLGAAVMVLGGRRQAEVVWRRK
jgi:hypothetical protein